MSSSSLRHSASLFRRSEAGYKSEKASLIKNQDVWNDDEDDDSGEACASTRRDLVGRKKLKADEDLELSNSRPLDTCVEMDIPSGSTLASLSLQYNLPVAELKRVNNIISENQLFALKRIKIPVKPHSYLKELIPDIHGSQDQKNTDGWLREHFSSPPLSNATSEISSPVLSETSESGGGGDSQAATVRTLGIRPKDSRRTKGAKKFLRAMDKDLAAIRQQSEKLMNHGRLQESELPDLNLSSAAAQPSAPSKWGLVSAVLVLVIVVLAILWYARHEFFLIQQEVPDDLEAFPATKGHHASLAHEQHSSQ